jgi:hypothetical protein
MLFLSMKSTGKEMWMLFPVFEKTFWTRELN